MFQENSPDEIGAQFISIVFLQDSLLYHVYHLIAHVECVFIDVMNNQEKNTENLA